MFCRAELHVRRQSQAVCPRGRVRLEWGSDYVTKEEIRWVNEHVSLPDLISEYYGMDVHVGYTTICPFHRDRRKSAKVYQDNALVCYTEHKTYRPYDVLSLNGVTDEVIRSRYSVPSDLKPRQAWAPPPEYVQAVAQVRKTQYSVEELMRLWEHLVKLMEAQRAEVGRA